MDSEKDKILFWLENHAVHFGIAKSFCDDFDCEPYGMIACTPKQNKFFSEQNLINFKKFWLVREHINLKSRNPDYEKLKFFEQKYSLNLHQLVYADRSFYKYNYYHKFSSEEIFSIVEQELVLYENILDEIKPDFVIMRTPEFQDIDIFYEMCKAKKIPVLLLTTARMGNRHKITSDPSSPVLFDRSNTNIKIRDFVSLKNYVDDFSKAHKQFLEDAQVKKNNKLNVLKLLFSTYNSSNINSYRDLGRTPFNTITKGISLSIRSRIRKSFLDKNTERSVKSKHSFAYFPLHMEPERSLLRKAQYHANQINVIKNVAQSLPVEMDLLVKEHPSMQLIGWQEIKFYKEIMSLPKVKLIHPHVPNSELIKNASLIIAIASTTALEAAFFEKPSIVFSDVDCSTLSSVLKVNTLEELPHLIKQGLTVKVNLVELNQFVNAVIESSFESDVLELQNKMSEIFGGGGYFIGNEISELIMKDFIITHEKSFKILSDEHIKKIQEFKKI